ncbi:hypothetical protein [Spirosoma agri]|uniref:Collagen-like protein n=1 Tax=Spirosoma agri TaxID=1987381 RepID=A0A6M0ITX1_9BACT|nr:hypothetical protein [Spirosoma agri]NEU70753.1 hypothetical protein [Spirosoma agri]
MLFNTTLTKFFGPLCLVLTITIFLAACKGDVGPKGDTGATGVGTTGATGATGPTGASGVAGVSGTSSVTMVTYPTSFTLSKNNSTFYTLLLPRSITKAVVDKSVIIVYLQFSFTGPIVWQIPATIGFGIEDVFTYSVYSESSDQLVGIYISRTSGTSLTSVTLAKVLIIPAANTITVNGRQAAVNYSDFEAVKAYYGLK